MSAVPAAVDAERRPGGRVPVPFRPPPSPEVQAGRALAREINRRRVTAAYYLALALAPATVAAAPGIGDDWPIAVLMLCYLVVTPLAGLAVLGFAVAEWTGRGALAVLGAALALPASVALLPLAGTAGREMALDRRAAELAGVVALVEAGGPEMVGLVNGISPGRGEPEPPAGAAAAARRARGRLREAGFTSVSAGQGYVRLVGWAPFAPDLLYLSGGDVPRVVDGCTRPRLRYAGGRWYLLECPGEYGY